MNIDLTWKENDVLVFLSIVIPTTLFSIYWFIFISEKIKNRFYSKFPGDTGKIKHILFTKYAGFIIMGVTPAILFFFIAPQFSLSQLGVSLSKGTNLLSLYWILGLGAVIIPMNWFMARRPKTFSMYPQIRVKEWNPKLILRYSLGWCAYLLGYEFLFRGILLIPLVNSLGVWPAIAINVALYSATHIPKGYDETIGAAPLGFVLCLITLQTGTIWVAFVVHMFLALSNSLVALKFHPEMKVVKTQSKS